MTEDEPKLPPAIQPCGPDCAVCSEPDMVALLAQIHEHALQGSKVVHIVFQRPDGLTHTMHDSGIDPRKLLSVLQAYEVEKVPKGVLTH